MLYKHFLSAMWLLLMLYWPVSAQGNHVPEWRDVLRHGVGIHQQHSIHGAVRDPADVWTVWIVYRKHLYKWDSQPWGSPGAVERMSDGGLAWHGASTVMLAEWFP